MMSGQLRHRLMKRKNDSENDKDMSKGFRRECGSLCFLTCSYKNAKQCKDQKVRGIEYIEEPFSHPSAASAGIKRDQRDIDQRPGLGCVQQKQRDDQKEHFRSTPLNRKW